MARRIPIFESDAFVSRLKVVIGEESVSSFSRKCGVGESTLRNVLTGAFPRADILVAIANAGAVTVDWLATGRLPKNRSDVRDASTEAFSAIQRHILTSGGKEQMPAEVDSDLLADAIAAMDEALAAYKGSVSRAKKARSIANLYLAFSKATKADREMMCGMAALVVAEWQSGRD